MVKILRNDITTTVNKASCFWATKTFSTLWKPQWLVECMETCTSVAYKLPQWHCTTVAHQRPWSQMMMMF